FSRRRSPNRPKPTSICSSSSATDIESEKAAARNRQSRCVNVVEQSPALADNVVCIAGDRTREMLNRATEMTGKCIAQRIAASLLRLSAQAGVRTPAGIHIESPVTRIDLASMAGLTYFTVSRTLSAWQKQGLVKSGRHRLTILDVSRLSEIAEPRIGTG
ncbi:Crp/Fnr family transcriptional regulator, partial [Rhodopseudomonas sp. BR0M22]|nr:Crp/Fnr family transcriptional regulator [Rhodopseudomonas sp. BR0M22]